MINISVQNIYPNTSNANILNLYMDTDSLAMVLKNTLMKSKKVPFRFNTLYNVAHNNETFGMG